MGHCNSMRFFRTANVALYETVRTSLDAAWNLAAHGCTCITPAESAPRDAQGRIVVAVDDAFVEYQAVQSLLPNLLADGEVEEIDESEYRAAVQQSADL